MRKRHANRLEVEENGRTQLPWLFFLHSPIAIDSSPTNTCSRSRRYVDIFARDRLPIYITRSRQISLATTWRYLLVIAIRTLGNDRVVTVMIYIRDGNLGWWQSHEVVANGGRFVADSLGVRRLSARRVCGNGFAVNLINRGGWEGGRSGRKELVRRTPVSQLSFSRNVDPRLRYSPPFVTPCSQVIAT